MGSLAGPKARREPAGEAKPNVCLISYGEAGAYCTVGLVEFKIKVHIFCHYGLTGRQTKPGIDASHREQQKTQIDEQSSKLYLRYHFCKEGLDTKAEKASLGTPNC